MFDHIRICDLNEHGDDGSIVLNISSRGSDSELVSRDWIKNTIVSIVVLEPIPIKVDLVNIKEIGIIQFLEVLAFQLDRAMIRLHSIVGDGFQPKVIVGIENKPLARVGIALGRFS